MIENQTCTCPENLTMLPVYGLNLAVDASGLTGGGSGGIIPNTGEGVGAFKLINGTTGQALKLPEGGTWLWITFGMDVSFNSSGANVLRAVSGAGISEGGSAITTSQNGIRYQAIILRIA